MTATRRIVLMASNANLTVNGRVCRSFIRFFAFCRPARWGWRAVGCVDASEAHHQSWCVSLALDTPYNPGNANSLTKRVNWTGLFAVSALVDAGCQRIEDPLMLLGLVEVLDSPVVVYKDAMGFRMIGVLFEDQVQPVKPFGWPIDLQEELSPFHPVFKSQGAQREFLELNSAIWSNIRGGFSTASEPRLPAGPAGCFKQRYQYSRARELAGIFSNTFCSRGSASA